MFIICYDMLPISTARHSLKDGGDRTVKFELSTLSYKI
jgi:hypothetical protein